MTKLIIFSILIILHQAYQRNWVEPMTCFWAQSRADHIQILGPRYRGPENTSTPVQYTSLPSSSRV